MNNFSILLISLLFWICSAVATSCGLKSIQDSMVNIFTEPDEMPTGYPSNEVQRESVFYNGVLYIYNGECLEVKPETAEEIGEVKSVNNSEWPSAEWEASHLMEGMRILKESDTDIIYAEISEYRYHRLEAAQ